MIVDNFAGGGGATTGIEAALGRAVDLAINHDAEAIAMHAINHPRTKHLIEDVWRVDPREATRGRPVELAWFSPDCKHFSKAKGGKSVNKRIRGLAWVALKWAKLVHPSVIVLENVEEFVTWGPLGDDGRPCPTRKGRYFRAFVAALRREGYEVDWCDLRACDYGAPTIRKRLFMVARCDRQPIAWPERTHGAPDDPTVLSGRLAPWRTAAECIDWSIPCPSIFERDRPLADATLRRIAAGIRRFVIDAPRPFIVPITHTTSGNRTHPVDAPMRTITTAKGGELMLAVPTLIQTGYGEREGQAPRVPGLHKPLGTAVDGQKHALVAAFLAKHYGGVVGSSLDDAIWTVTATDHHSLVASSLVKLRGTSSACATDAPLHTVSAQGMHFGEVRAFLVKFYSQGGQWASPADPMHTIPTKDRLGLVTVAGEDYAIVDIGMRMLQPRELFLAQGFPAEYVIDFAHEGRALPKSSQVRLCGNSVCPPLAEAIVRANFEQRAERRAA